MHPKSKRPVRADLDVIPIGAPAGELEWFGCVNCREPLELHQPNTRSPDRLLGVCTRCGQWYVLLVASPSEALLVVLPVDEWFLAVSNTHEPPDTTDTAQV